MPRDPSQSGESFDQLSTEQSAAGAPELDRLSTAEVLAYMNQADQSVAMAVQAALPQITAAVDAINAALEAGGSLFYVGAGTSGRLGVLDAAECPPTFGVSPDLVRGLIAGGPRALVRSVEAAEDDPEQGAADLRDAGFEKGDAFVGIATSGRTPYVIGAAKYVRQIGAVTCAIVCSPGSPLAAAVDQPIEVLTGPEILTGSTRLKAGTATKMILNMISTAAMIRLGYVLGNLMVNVQPTNQKLVDRARRIIMQVTGVDTDRAAELLEASGRNPKIAIVMQQRNASREEAEKLLEAVDGNLRDLLP